MDFYVDLAVAVLLRLLKDRRAVAQYYDALAKVYAKIGELAQLDHRLKDAIANREPRP